MNPEQHNPNPTFQLSGEGREVEPARGKVARAFLAVALCVLPLLSGCGGNLDERPDPNPTFQLPGQWSTVAPEVDRMYYFLYWLSVVLFVGITGAVVYFVWKYHAGRGHKAEPTGHNTKIEVAWTIAPVFLLAILFHQGFKGYMHLRVPPADAIEIRVRAQKWSWNFEYPNGLRRNMGEGLVVPFHRPVHITISSEDVLHSFYVPAFRVKQDAVPGYYTSLWFEATQLSAQSGDIDIFCAEYCGKDHSAMHSRVHVVPAEEYERILAEGPKKPNGYTDEQWGHEIFTGNGCPSCHGANGEGGQGPRLQGLFGRQEPLQDGSTVSADADYIRRSILTPQAQIVRGFTSVQMPSFYWLARAQQDALIAHLRSLH